MSPPDPPDESAPISEDTEQQVIEQETERLRRHVGSSCVPNDPNAIDIRECPLFLVEISPPQYKDINPKCRLPSCVQEIAICSYRIALVPSMTAKDSSEDLYHIECFEKIADLTLPDFLFRLKPLIWPFQAWRTWPDRYDAKQGRYFIDCGGERLVEEWKLQRGKWIDKRAGRGPPAPDPVFWDMYYNAGSAQFTPQGNLHYRYMQKWFAPIQSDGPDDKDEWSLFREYLPNDSEEQALDDRHNLSRVLEKWRQDKRNSLRYSPSRKLSDKFVKAVRRLETVFLG